MDQLMMMRLGQSKMDKMQEEFVMTHKETGLNIIREYGDQVFSMWWYIESLCYGKNKVTAFPKKETIAQALNIDPSTVQRRIRKLEQIKAVKRVKLYNKNGARTSNLLIVNASFPEVPEGWDEIYQYGAYQPRFMEYVPLQSPEDKPWANLHIAIEQHIYSHDGGKTQQNSTVQICTQHSYAIGKSAQGYCADLPRGGVPQTPGFPTDEVRFFGAEEENLKKKNLLLNNTREKVFSDISDICSQESSKQFDPIKDHPSYRLNSGQINSFQCSQAYDVYMKRLKEWATKAPKPPL